VQVSFLGWTRPYRGTFRCSLKFAMGLTTMGQLHMAVFKMQPD